MEPVEELRHREHQRACVVELRSMLMWFLKNKYEVYKTRRAPGMDTATKMLKTEKDHDFALCEKLQRRASRRYGSAIRG